PDHKQKDFLTLTFEDAPMVAGMASISQLETQVLEYESDALGLIAEEVGAKDVEFTTIVPLIRPKSNVVAAGAKFEAELFITAAASGANPVFKYDGKAAEKATNEFGIEYGKVEFAATAGKYDPKTLLAEKSFNATIELNDTTFTIPHTYYVAKPVIQVKSAALQALYQNCGNELDIQVPALGTSYNPSFSSREAQVRKGNRTGLVTVIPQGRSKVKLNVSNNGSLLGTEIFDVKKVPPPNIVITSRNKPLTGDGVPAAAISTIRVSAEPDENFKREVPKDARYRVRKVTVKLARSGRAVRTAEFNSENIDLRQWRSQLRPGDALIINVEQVFRRTFTGDNERAKPLTEIYTIPIN
ncbi:MAG: GldM family protein, partial [Cyclobacteriaceae bacterium]